MSPSQKAVLEKAKEAAASLEGEDKEAGALYIKLMEKAIDKGGDYLENEKARVTRLVSDGSMTSEKVC